jgi:ureidoglycolate lyase
MAALMASSGERRVLVAEPLTAEGFRVYGDVIDRGADDRAGRSGHAINTGTAWRRHDLAHIDAARGGHAAISIVRAEPRPLPFRLQCLERHVRGTQAFVPLDATRWLVVVCGGGDRPRIAALRVFAATAGQGVNYRRGTWHHPLIAIERTSEFVVVDRVADDGLEDCEVHDLGPLDLWITASLLS